MSLIEQSMHDQSRVMGQALLFLFHCMLPLSVQLKFGTHYVLHSRQRDEVKKQKKELTCPPA